MTINLHILKRTRLNKRFVLLSIGLVGVVSSAAVTLALNHPGNQTLAANPDHLLEQSPPQLVIPESAPAEVVHSLRFSYVPEDAHPHIMSPSSDLPWSVETLEGAALPESWSTEIQTRTAPGSKKRRTGKRKRRYTLKQRLKEISPKATRRIAKKFEAANAVWPPADIALVAIKDTRHIELFARPEEGEWKFIDRYSVLAASGVSGPKLRRGDKQVPEGVYRITYLNPNSRYHVSLRVNYPNAFDRKMARKDGRKDLGGDIMIHGKNSSAGCLAIGDDAAEELFVLAANIGMKNIKLIIAPTDFRKKELPKRLPKQPKWVPKLYSEVSVAMAEFNAPPQNPSLLTLLGF
jgi:L,D-transpeptidase-like protein